MDGYMQKEVWYTELDSIHPILMIGSFLCSGFLFFLANLHLLDFLTDHDEKVFERMIQQVEMFGH